MEARRVMYEIPESYHTISRTSLRHEGRHEFLLNMSDASMVGCVGVSACLAFGLTHCMRKTPWADGPATSLTRR